MITERCNGCCGEFTAGTLCPQCFPTAKSPEPVVFNVDGADSIIPPWEVRNTMNKSLTRREGDYIWFRGKKRLWRTLSKEERKRAIKDMKEEQNNDKSFVKRKTW